MFKIPHEDPNKDYLKIKSFKNQGNIRLVFYYCSSFFLIYEIFQLIIDSLTTDLERKQT